MLTTPAYQCDCREKRCKVTKSTLCQFQPNQSKDNNKFNLISTLTPAMSPEKRLVRRGYRKVPGPNFTMYGMLIDPSTWPAAYSSGVLFRFPETDSLYRFNALKMLWQETNPSNRWSSTESQKRLQLSSLTSVSKSPNTFMHHNLPEIHRERQLLSTVLCLHFMTLSFK